MRRVAIITTSRADYGIYRPILRRAMERPELEVLLIVSGSHLHEAHGATVSEIVNDGIPIAARVPTMSDGDDGQAVARSMGAAVTGLALSYADLSPEVVVVLGDRYEMHAAALAALPLCLPVAHIHGGELSLGAFDESIRHSMTKLSHLHFVSTHEYGRRVAQMGEEPWRITVCGAPSLDNLRSEVLLTAEQALASVGMEPKPPPIIMAFHAPTLDSIDVRSKINAVLAAVERTGLPALLTAPNADPGSQIIRGELSAFASRVSNAIVIESAGSSLFLGLLAGASVLVGNSSAGIIEAASFGLPVVNVGDRQAGRTRGRNVIDVGYAAGELDAGIKKALDPPFRASLVGMENPYDQGGAAPIVVDRLIAVDLGMPLLRKKFWDLSFS